jgi:hypothetical protein
LRRKRDSSEKAAAKVAKADVVESSGAKVDSKEGSAPSVTNPTYFAGKSQRDAVLDKIVSINAAHVSRNAAFDTVNHTEDYLKSAGMLTKQISAHRSEEVTKKIELRRAVGISKASAAALTDDTGWGRQSSGLNYFDDDDFCDLWL